MTDAELRERMWASLISLQRRLGTPGSDGRRLYEEDGILAAIVPTVPEASLVNAGLAQEPATSPSPAAIARLAEAYAGAGLPKWGFWLDPGRQSPDALAAAGLVRDSTPAAMAAPLGELDLTGTEPEQPCDARTAALVNDLAYGHADDRLLRALEPMTAGGVHGYRADDAEGEPIAALMVGDHDGDAAVWFVATVPWAQRQGHATRLLRRALHDARERGCTTTSLQASRAGRPLYARIGYRWLGDLELWEHRP